MSQKYYTTRSRYVDGKYITASPDYPVLVEFPDDLEILEKDGVPLDRSLSKAEGAQGEKLPLVLGEKAKEHFARINRGPSSVPARERDKTKRASDVDPA